MKDSGIAWVGKIPDGWKVIANKHLFTLNKTIVNNPDNFQLLSLTTKGVKEKNIEDVSGKVPENYNGYQVVEKNDLIMCLFDLDCSAVFSGISDYNGMISPAYKVFKTKESYFGKFAGYWFDFIGRDRLYKQFSKTLRYTITSEEFLCLKSVVPPICEQQKIADYLDGKCGEIDILKEDIKKQIETLEQYKRSVITEAVTKGLNKSAPLKDSGIPWIGAIPENWKCVKGKYLLKYLQKPVKPSDGVITCFRDGEVTLRSNRREDGFTMADKEIGYQGVDVGDLVVHGMDGFAGAIGISDSRGKASPALNVLDTYENKRFIMYYLRSMAYNDVFLALATGIRVRSCDLRWNKLAELLYPVPPIEEQNKIVKCIDETILKVNELISDKQSQIETLEEYKKSLIFEYVTGKKQVG